jgi:hypothetical protein
MKRLLMIAYHFPPLRGSSGIQRTLRFAQHLPEHGWQPAVLTVHPRAYESRGRDLLEELPAGMPVIPAFALDAARHLSIGGRYPQRFATPDRWATWRGPAVRAGRRLIETWKPDALWSTFPIPTAHRIGLDLHRRTMLPWVADFRDPMAQPDYPPDPRLRKVLADLEAEVVRTASVSVFVAGRALDECRARHPDVPEDRFAVIENGFDEASFAGLAPTRPFGKDMFLLLHSGLIDAADRDPAVLLQALAKLHGDGVIGPQNFRLVFRAPGNGRWLARLAAEHSVGDLVAILPAIGYRAALAEMLGADALLVVQGASCASQVPAKVYEYARTGRPILGLTDPGSATDAALGALGVRERLGGGDAPRLAAQLRALISVRAAAPGWTADPRAVEGFSRERLTSELAHLLDRVTQR